jgi:hypothetical protein
VVLDPGTDVCVSRNATRPPIEQFFFDGYDERARVEPLAYGRDDPLPNRFTSASSRL